MALDAEVEARVKDRLIEHFSRLGYFKVEDAACWSLSLGGALVRFLPLLPLLGAGLDHGEGSGAGEPATTQDEAATDLSRFRLLISGMGSGSEMIAARNFGFGEIYGTELDPFYISLVSDRLAGHPGFFPTAVDGRSIPFGDDTFDVVVSGHIVEHTADPASYVAEHLRVLKPGGYFLLEFPTRFHTRELHTGLPSIEWLPERVRTGILLSIGRGAFWFSEDTRKKCRAITDTALKQISLRRVRKWVVNSESRAALVAKGRPGPGVVYGIFLKSR
ncbi:MAG: class I SAM-dependent methyltransferase [Candidatus Eisenbacteria bacterium]|nr:class I SAM-dependent methyltransferase [Candidatus Eisenbacteria bacterium]